MAGVILFGNNPLDAEANIYVCRSSDPHCGGEPHSKFFSDSSAYITYHRAKWHNDNDEGGHAGRAWNKTKNLVERWYREWQMPSLEIDGGTCQIGNCHKEDVSLSVKALAAHYVTSHPGTSYGDEAMKLIATNGLEEMLKANRRPKTEATERPY